jgi:hypothetical protein
LLFTDQADVSEEDLEQLRVQCAPQRLQTGESMSSRVLGPVR